MNLKQQTGIREVLRDTLRAELPQLEPFMPVAVYLFGSLSRGAGHADSDIDLAFLPARPCDPVEVFEVANRLAERLGRQVDLVDLRRASTVMRKEVLRTGTLLHESDSARRMEFEMLALSDYARLNEEREPVLRKLSTPAA
jgi:predicted nucleotidyltransferase